MTRTLVPLAAALAAAPFLVATASAQGLTIHSANMTFATGALSPTTPTAPELDLRATAGGPDHGYRHGWFYRLAGDPQEYAFAGLGPSTASVTAAQDHADRDFADVDNRGLLRAALDCDTYSTGATTGFATSRLTVRNVSAVAQTIDLFAYVDLDVGGTFNNDIAIGAPMLHAVRDWTGVQIEVRAVDADRSDVLAHPLLLNLLTDANVDDLGNHAPPFAGDYTSAFQWSAVVLTPGEQRSFTLVLAVDETATDAAVVEAYGRGSTAGAEIH
ncbi:MAG: hypothetical protein KDE27_30150, partial [Planctomycetes bacterium]|nr:hypothetical protein [Planctomycetota bacterium]